MKPASCVCLSFLLVIGWISSTEATNYVDLDQRIKLPDIEYLQHSESIHDGNKRQKRKIMYFKMSPNRKWPTTINYMISTDLQLEQHQTIEKVIREDFEANTCLKFNRILHSNESKDQFIYFKGHGPFEASACKAYIGKENDTRTFHGQPIYLGNGCLEIHGSVVHMIAATLGMYNEIQRPDRDKYVQVFFKNIDPNGISNFIKQSETSVVTHDVPYDYASALHYRSKAWLASGAQGKHTVLPWDRSLTHLLGQLSEISFYDIQVLNHAYCSHICTKKKICYNGGYQDPKNCSNCLCPDGYAGYDCRNIRQGSSMCTPLSGKIDVTEAEQCVSSPGYEASSSYPQGSHCSWRLDAPPHKYIDFWFHQSVFGLPHLSASSTDNIHNDICVHWVEVKYKGLDATRGARYCNKDNKVFLDPAYPTKYKFQTSNASSVLVLFKSPPAYTRKLYSPNLLSGFKLCFKLSSGAITTTTTTPTTAGFEPNVEGKAAPVEGHGGINMLTWIIVVIAILLLTVIMFAIVIVCLLYRRKKKQPETVVVANGMNNPGYAEHTFPVVSFHEPEGLDKKMAVFGAMGVSIDDLPPKYDDVPEVPAYAISGEQVKDGNINQADTQQNDFQPYEIPSNLVPAAENPVPSEESTEVIYQNAPAIRVNQLKQKFQS